MYTLLSLPIFWFTFKLFLRIFNKHRFSWCWRFLQNKSVMGPVLSLYQGFRSVIFYLVDLNLPKNAITIKIPIKGGKYQQCFDNKILELMRLMAKPMPYNKETFFYVSESPVNTSLNFINFSYLNVYSRHSGRKARHRYRFGCRQNRYR